MDFSSFIFQTEPKPESRISVCSAKSGREDGQMQTSKDYMVPKLTAAAFTTVLETAADSLMILGNMMDLPKVNVELDYRSLSNKYSKPYRKHIYDSETLETREEALEKERNLKFHRDR